MSGDFKYVHNSKYKSSKKKIEKICISDVNDISEHQSTQ